MDKKEHITERLWEHGWTGHEKAQLFRNSKLSFREKIEWLEEAQEFIDKLDTQKTLNKQQKK